VRRPSLAVAAVVLVAAPLAACHSGAGTAAPKTGTTAAAAPAKGAAPADVNVCTLLPAAQAATLTGQAITSAAPSTIVGGQDKCEYADSAGTALDVVVDTPGSGVDSTP
jgi:hypothetical protein